MCLSSLFPLISLCYNLRSCLILSSVAWPALYNSLRYNRDYALILIMTFFQVIEHQPYDSCCDWWSLGVMLYYMLTSKVCDRSCEFIVTLVPAADISSFQKLPIISSFQKFDRGFASTTKLVRYKNVGKRRP